MFESAYIPCLLSHTQKNQPFAEGDSKNLRDEVAIEAMKNGIRFGKLKEKILTKEPATFFEVMAMTTKLIKLDEDRRTRRYDDKIPFKRDERSEHRRPRVQRPYLRGPTGNLQKEVESYTSLNAPKSKSLCESEQMKQEYLYLGERVLLKEQC